MGRQRTRERFERRISFRSGFARWQSLLGFPSEKQSALRKANRCVSADVRRLVRIACFSFVLLYPGLLHAQSETTDDTLAGADKGEHAPEDQPHLFGDWNGERKKLLERGLNFNLEYVSDWLWNVQSVQKERLAVFERVRGTLDFDFGRLSGIHGLFLHITAVYQGGGNLGKYLGTITGPSGLASANTFRLDSWWLEKRSFGDRLVVRFGQFAAQDFYGTQLFGPSFVFEPLQYALTNLFSTVYESFDPPSTPAAELRVIPRPHIYVKSMVFVSVRDPYSINPTGLVPQFRGDASSASEIGYSPGKDASAVRAQDNVEARKGYSGLYRFGAVYNSGKFTSTSSPTPVSGNYLIYGQANQAIYRTSREGSRGIDVTVNADWSPRDRSRNNQVFTAGARFNEPLPIRLHNLIGVAYVRNGINESFPVAPPTVSVRDAEHGFEANVLVEFPHAITLQPVVQYYINTGGSSNNALVCGFHTKIDF
jgi:porin